jgi:hypothetical protein
LSLVGANVILESGDLFIDGKISTFWQNRQSLCHEKVLIVTLSINKVTLSIFEQHHRFMLPSVMSTSIPNNSSLLQEVRRRRYRENVANVFKLVGMFVLAVAAAWIVMLLAAPHRAVETTNVIVVLFWVFLAGAFYVGWNLLFLFWPILLYFWASIKAANQWTLLSLLQTSIETGKPLRRTKEIFRAFARTPSFVSFIFAQWFSG